MVVAVHMVIVVFVQLIPEVVETHMGTAAYLLLSQSALTHSVVVVAVFVAAALTNTVRQSLAEMIVVGDPVVGLANILE